MPLDYGSGGNKFSAHVHGCPKGQPLCQRIEPSVSLNANAYLNFKDYYNTVLYSIRLLLNCSYFKTIFFRSYLWDSSGLQDYWRKKLAPQVNQCRLKYNSRGGSAQVIKDLAVRFKLQQYYLAFLLLFTGFVFAFIQFIRERIAWNSIPIIDDVDDQQIKGQMTDRPFSLG